MKYTMSLSLCDITLLKSGAVDAPAVTDTLQMLEFAAALYAEQAASHRTLTAKVCTDSPDAVDAVDSAWDSAIHRNARVLSGMLRETTSIERTRPP